MVFIECEAIPELVAIESSNIIVLKFKCNFLAWPIEIRASKTEPIWESECEWSIEGLNVVVVAALKSGRVWAVVTLWGIWVGQVESLTIEDAFTSNDVRINGDG